MKKRRWSNNDRHFWPFTLSLGDWRKFGMMFDSGSDDSPGCHLRLYAFSCTLLMELPSIFRPCRRWVDTSGYEWSRGAGGYWDEHAREYGFTVSEGALHLHYGAQTHDSSTCRSKVWFIPWQSWRFVRHSLYGLSGEHFWTESDRRDWDAAWAAKEACPSVTFEFDDYDGERITARTIIEEREWHFGEGWFKWLSWFRRPRVIRSLEIAFSAETGRRKGSWKGGTIGHGIDMLPGELHEAAFRRYCAEHEMTFVGVVE